MTGYRRHYAGDPHWLTARYPGRCKRCGEPFKAGERVFYYPRGKAVYAGPCAEREAAAFEAAAFDEDIASASC